MTLILGNIRSATATSFHLIVEVLYPSPFFGFKTHVSGAIVQIDIEAQKDQT